MRFWAVLYLAGINDWAAAGQTMDKKGAGTLTYISVPTPLI